MKMRITKFEIMINTVRGVMEVTNGNTPTKIMVLRRTGVTLQNDDVQRFIPNANIIHVSVEYAKRDDPKAIIYNEYI
jgi:hypothetical protein